MKRFIILASLMTSVAAANPAQALQFVTNGNFLSLSNGPGKLENNQDTSATGWTTGGYNFVDSVDPTGQTGGGQQGMELWDAYNVAADNAYHHTSYGLSNTWNGNAPGQTGGYSTSTQNFAVLDGDYGTVYPLTQTITGLTVGDTYTLSFDYAFGQQKGSTGATSQSLEANLGAAGGLVNANSPVNGSNPYWSFPGGATWTSKTVAVASEGFSGWNTESLTVTASSTTEVLSFLAASSPSIPPFALVTDVSLTGGAASGVPELSTWSMMLIGVGVLGVAGRRRRRALATA